MIISFIFFLLMFTLIGVSSAWKSRGTRHDYYLASGSIKPWLVGLSAVATNNSGYMFIGVIGYTYVTGLASIWLMIGWIAGDFLASTFVHSRLRAATAQTGEVSYAGVLSNWYGGNNAFLQRMIGAISLVFLLAYASAQLVAGSKALHVLFGWPSWAGAAVGAVLVTAYCFAGGIRASIWTDAAQSIVMMLAMCLMLIIATLSFGGIDNAIAEMQSIAGFLDWFPQDTALPGLAGGLLFAVSWMFAGLSVIGQPHIMVRFMTLNDTGKMRRARLWYSVVYRILRNGNRCGAVIAYLPNGCWRLRCRAGVAHHGFAVAAAGAGWPGARRYFCRHHVNCRLSGAELFGRSDTRPAAP